MFTMEPSKSVACRLSPKCKGQAVPVIDAVQYSLFDQKENYMYKKGLFMYKLLKVSKQVVLTGCFISLFLLGGTANAVEQTKAGEVECRMNFTMKSWSFLYKSGKGTGEITCDNGQSAGVKLRSHGGGITAGKSKIINGLGVFTKVASINELFGNYANAEAHAGAVGSASARALTKGEVSLSLTGTGKGIDLGINFGNMKITRR